MCRRLVLTAALLVAALPARADEPKKRSFYFSYRGTVTVTVIADARLVPHPELITQAFAREIATLGRRVRRARSARTTRTVSRSPESDARAKPT